MHVDLDDPGSRKLTGLVLLLGAGLLFVLGINDLRQTLRMRDWARVPCDIVQSAVTIERGRRVERPYHFQVSYRYVWRGQPFVGQLFRERLGTYDSIAEADKVARVYPVRARTSCYVDPSNPSNAVLEQNDLFDPIGMLVLGAVLMVPPVGFLLIPGRPKGSAAKLVGVDRRVLLVCIPILFLGGVGGFGYFAVGMYQSLAARIWKLTPCRVIHSEVRSHVVSGGEAHFRAYWADVAYAYMVNGREYRSNQYNFTERSTPWFYGKRAIVDRYAPGQAATCYVNPADPTEAVLSLGWRMSAWFSLWPLVITFFGACMLLDLCGLTRTKLLSRKLSMQEKRQLSAAGAAALAGLASQLFVVLGSDLARDARAGKADIFEWGAVTIAFLAMAGAMALFLKTMRAARGQRAGVGGAS